jgi:DNA polymerase
MAVAAISPPGAARPPPDSVSLTGPALLHALGSRGEVICTIDFEGYWSSEFTLSKLTNEQYIRDPRFEVIGVAVKWGAQPAVWLEEWEFRRWAAGVDWSRVAVNAHQAQFDGFIMSERYGIVPAFWYCTLSMGRAFFGSADALDLDAVGERLGLGRKTVGALEATKGKRRADFTQAEWLRFGDYAKQDAELSHAALFKMGKGFPPLEFWIIDSTVRMTTEPVFRGDQTLLAKAAAAEREKKRKALEKVAAAAGVADEPDPLKAAAKALRSRKVFPELLRSYGIEPGTKISKSTGQQTFAFAKDDPFMKGLLEHDNPEVAALAEAKLAVSSTIIGTRSERMLGIAQRGTIPIYLKYCGAHTGRDSGGDQINPQNLNRGGELRDALMMEEGECCVVADSGQVEARKLMWLAGEERVVQTFRDNDAEMERGLAQAEREGVNMEDEDEAKAFWKRYPGGKPDFYSKLGTTMFFLRPISPETTPIERQISKNMALGLGFYMGWARFGTESLKGMMGSKPVQFKQAEADKFHVDVTAFACRRWGEGTCADAVREIAKTFTKLTYGELLIHFAVADHFVSVYRRANPSVARFWKTCDEMIRVMSQDGDGVKMEYKGVRVLHHAIVLPSGRRLRYPGLRRGQDGWSYRGDHGKGTHIYGGLLCENIVQAMARDVVFEQAMRCRAAGLRLATRTHDEIVARSSAATARADLAFMLATMRVPPAWCADIPLYAEGGAHQRYGFAK